jgi:hypothetical protein
MKLLLLGKKFMTNSNKYYGVSRETPGFFESQDEDKNLVYWEFSESCVHGLLENINFAKRIVQIYKSLIPPQDFEIIEVTIENNPPENENSLFFGFDIACNYSISALSYDLEIDHVNEKGPYFDLDKKLLPLYRLFKLHFQPLLNAHGLFMDYADAQFCLEAMNSIQLIRPNFWEGEHCQFQVLGIWRIES